MRGKQLFFCAFASVTALLTASPARLRSQSANASSPPASPPVAPVRPVTDDYHGTKVPYRYVENFNDAELQAWLKAQNDYTRAVLAGPGRELLFARIRELDQSAPRVRAWRLPDNVYIIGKRLPSEDTSKLYLRRGLNGEDKLLVDPEKISLSPVDQGKGKNLIQSFAVSDNAAYIALGIWPGGDELHGEVHVIDTATGQETGDVLTQLGAKAWQPYWMPDNRSFVYGRLQKPSTGAPAAEVRQKFRAYLHVLGTDPEKDHPVFGYGVVPSIDVDPSLIASVRTHPGSGYALGLLDDGVTPNSSYYIAPVEAVGKSEPAWRKVADLADGVTNIAVHDDDLYLLTYKDAPRYKIIRLDARKPDLASAETVVAQSQGVIREINAAQDGLYLELLDGGIDHVLRVPYGPHPPVEEVSLPFAGSAFVSTDPRLPGALLGITSWTKAFKICVYDPQTKQVTDTQLQPAGPYDDPNNIESVEVKVQSYDGTLVPLSITHPKDLKLDGSNPALLEGYGAYGLPNPPLFDSTRLAWYGKGGVYAVCHVRGGAEHREEWHLAGKEGKEATTDTTWRDLLACAQYLIDKKYTSPARLGGEGVGAGGILIGRAITLRPDLFAAAIRKVGLSDTLRAELTQSGETNIPEFGSVKTEEGLKALYAMNYHIRRYQTAYPAVLLEAGMDDPRTDLWQMAKMTAQLQGGTSSGKPVLLRVDYAGGHGTMGATRTQALEQRADEWSFLLWQFGVQGFGPSKP
jgi:prolyl oligopeptidase